MTTTRITTLVENTAGGRSVLGEHGLAFWIETDCRRILFDSGQGRVLSLNAASLGIRLAEVDSVILSHGHYDHTGGLAQLLDQAEGVKVFVHPAAFGPKYSRDRTGTVREVGMPATVVAKVRAEVELMATEGPMEVGGGVYVTGPIPRRSDFEDTGGAFFLDDRCQQADSLEDDQAAFLETRDGIVVILGCAHAGVISTLDYITELSGGKSIHTVIGGMHLLHASKARLEKTVAALQRLGVRRLLPGHCTGFAATAQLWQQMPDRCAPCAAGTVLVC